jgi:three-Cys-motif partner protein
VGRQYPDRDVRFLAGDVNALVPAILEQMPRYGSGQTVLGFCFADPYRMRDLRFETVRGLAGRYMDFLILIPTGMDATRAWRSYLKDENETVDLFLGTGRWRDEWREQEQKGVGVDRFLTSFYHRQMQDLGYEHGRIDDTVLIRLPGKNVPLYRLGFFSRHPLGVSFWRQVRKYSAPQTDLFRQ